MVLIFYNNVNNLTCIYIHIYTHHIYISVSYQRNAVVIAIVHGFKYPVKEAIVYASRCNMRY